MALGFIGGGAVETAVHPEAATEEQVVCYHGWSEPVEVNLRGHRFALVTHRCRKTILHKGDEHECACGRKWAKI